MKPKRNVYQFSNFIQYCDTEEGKRLVASGPTIA